MLTFRFSFVVVKWTITTRYQNEIGTVCDRNNAVHWSAGRAGARSWRVDRLSYNSAQWKGKLTLVHITVDLKPSTAVQETYFRLHNRNVIIDSLFLDDTLVFAQLPMFAQKFFHVLLTKAANIDVISAKQSSDCSCVGFLVSKARGKLRHQFDAIGTHTSTQNENEQLKKVKNENFLLCNTLVYYLFLFVSI